MKPPRADQPALPAYRSVLDGEDSLLDTPEPNAEPVERTVYRALLAAAPFLALVDVHEHRESAPEWLYVGVHGAASLGTAVESVEAAWWAVSQLADIGHEVLTRLRPHVPEGARADVDLLMAAMKPSPLDRTNTMGARRRAWEDHP